MADEPEKALEAGETNGRQSSRAVSFLSKSFYLGPVNPEWSDMVLLTHSLTTGMVDAASFSNWGVFVGMQTGNTVILGLSTATIPTNPYAWLTTLVSIASYLLGAFCTFRLTARLFPTTPTTKSTLPISRSRLYLFAILLSQALLIMLAASLCIPSDLIPHNPAGKLSPTTVESTIRKRRIVSLLAPLAFQSGIQIATSRLLGFNELPVNVLTSTYCDLMGDARLFVVRRNVKRNRRAASVVLLLVGAICAGWLMRSAAGLTGVFWIAGGLKFLAAVAALCFLKTG